MKKLAFVDKNICVACGVCMKACPKGTVIDSSLVDEPTLKQSGAAGIIVKGEGVQVIYGPRVTVIKSELEDYIATL